ncbi:MAG: hypothetical protein E7604_06815 [Ruminococcaceae bacterium]|nr:hypothetical protein [Oscillospiraceae bacterium]
MKKIVRKTLKILLIVLAVIAVLALAAVITIKCSGAHRSDPADIRQYEMTNPHANTITAISAHRSGGGIAPENTMMALKNCAENPDFSISVFEFDLHITADGYLILLHDDTLDRTSDAETVFGETEVRPENKTLAELKTLNMGAKFKNDAGEMPFAALTGDAVPKDLRILTIDETLDYLCAMGEYDFIIEIKNSGDLGRRGVDTLCAVLEKRNLFDRVAFGTFHEEISRYVDETYPMLSRSTSIDEVISFYIAALTNSKTYEPPCTVLQIPFTAKYLNMGINLGTAQVINYAHSHNMAIQYWTINNEDDMRYLVSMGADCIMTDYPDRLYRVMTDMGILAEN